MTTRMTVFPSAALDRLVRRWLARIASLDDVARIAVMPDVHLAGDACVGTAIATRSTIVPTLLGSDLGCGVGALDLGVDARRLDRRTATELLHELARAIPSRRSVAAAPPADLDLDMSDARLARALRDARVEHGTLGRGNHFLEIQEDEHARLWLMVHTGSRALGPAIQAHHTRAAPRRHGLALLDAGSTEADAYLADHDRALALPARIDARSPSERRRSRRACSTRHPTRARGSTAITTPSGARRTRARRCGYIAREPSPQTKGRPC